MQENKHCSPPHQVADQGGTKTRILGPGAQNAVRTLARAGMKTGIADVTPIHTDCTRWSHGCRGCRLGGRIRRVQQSPHRRSFLQKPGGPSTCNTKADTAGLQSAVFDCTTGGDHQHNHGTQRASAPKENLVKTWTTFGRRVRSRCSSCSSSTSRL